MNAYTRDFRLLFAEVKSRLSVTKWQLTGFVAIFIAVMWISQLEKKDSIQQRGFLSDPQQGDVYKFKLEKNYSTFMVVDVTPDSVTVYPNQYDSRKMGGIRLIDKPENYMFLPMSFSKKELSAMFKEGTIYEIDR